jgi:hypothetical protein
MSDPALSTSFWPVQTSRDAGDKAFEPIVFEALQDYDTELHTRCSEGQKIESVFRESRAIPERNGGSGYERVVTSDRAR